MKRRDFLLAAAATPLCLYAVRSGLFGDDLLLEESVSTSAARKLPDWFVSARVHAHTRLGPARWHDKPQYQQASTIFKKLGASVVTRHVKSTEEAPSWPTKVGHGDPADHARKMIADAHAAGLRIITYYWDMSDAEMEQLHPEWVCEDSAGEKRKHKRRGNFLDITGPYREVVLTRLLELAERGSDGFYFDNMHLPAPGCWSREMIAAFERASGRRMPRAERADDPDYLAFLEFTAQRVADTFKYWQDSVHRRYPDTVFVVSTTFLPALVSRRMSTRLASTVDSAKTELNIAMQQRFNELAFMPRFKLTPPRDDLRNALGWAMLRDAADGRPPHVWAGGFPNKDQACAFAGAVMTWGGIANMDLDEGDMLAAKPSAVEQRNAVAAALALGNAAGPVLGEMRPLRWAAIHFAEAARNRRGGNYVQAARDVVLPMTGAFGAFVDKGVPVGVVTDDQLGRGELAEYSVLFLPTPNELSAAQKSAVSAFEQRGGLVVRNDWQWASAQAMQAAQRKLLAAVGARLQDAPVVVSGLGAGQHGVPYRNEAGNVIAVALTNAFTWIQEQGSKPTVSVNSAPRPASGIDVRVRGSFGGVREVITGKALRASASGGRVSAAVPTFDNFALVVFR
jgi:hypothetical protein